MGKMIRTHAAARAVSAVEKSGDMKLSLDGSASATWAAQVSCADDCPFYNSGCYAEGGRAGFQTRRLNTAAMGILGLTAEQVAEAEAEAIDTLTGMRPLRLHVVGDCKTEAAVSIVAAAAARYHARHGAPVWTYTHAHNTRRETWGIVSVLRSCETIEQVKRAHAEGFAAAMVTAAPHDSRRAVDLGAGFTGIPCPQQTGAAASCVDCRLCMRDKALHAGKRVILFSPHGRKETVAARVLAANETRGKRLLVLPTI